METRYYYIIIGGGLAGISAAKAIREVDSQRSILIVGEERYKPYNRPPLSKGLWTGDKNINEIFVRQDEFYKKNSIVTLTETSIVGVNRRDKTITDGHGYIFHYEKLLIATGGNPRMIPVDGGDIPNISYFRTLDDYRRIRESVSKHSHVLVVGGGFIGSEMAAALNTFGSKVSIIFPEKYLGSNIFPESLAEAIQKKYEEKGVMIHSENKPSFIQKKNEQFIIDTENGKQIVSDFIIAGFKNSCI